MAIGERTTDPWFSFISCKTAYYLMKLKSDIKEFPGNVIST